MLLLNTNALKDQLDALLDRTSAGGGRINFPDWLEDEFWHEMVAEVRTAKGWEKTAPRNEAWDLLVYTLGVALYRPIKIEHFDWDNPPRWAEEWDDNELVFEGEEAPAADPGEKENKQTLEDLAALLA